MKIMVIHPGHDHSTSDVFDGLCAGLARNGVEVIPFAWGRILKIFNALVIGGQRAGTIKTEQAEDAHNFVTWLAAADALTVAVDSQVDAAIVVNGLLFPPSRVTPLRKYGIPVACYGTEAPYFLESEREIAPFYSHWFTNERQCVGQFGDVPSFYLPHAYNPDLHTPDGPRVPGTVVFVGGGYPERKALIDGARADGMPIATFGTLWQLDLAAERGAADSGRNARYTAGVIDNAETSARHRGATIALNLHRRMTYVETGGSIAPGSASSLGPRAYEIPAVGGFMLCDDERAELHEVYGESAATFRAWDSADLARQLRYWLTHDDARARAQRAQAQAVAPHHWGNRAKTVLDIILA